MTFSVTSMSLGIEMKCMFMSALLLHQASFSYSFFLPSTTTTATTTSPPFFARQIQCHHNNNNNNNNNNNRALNAVDLSTSFEWLANERQIEYNFDDSSPSSSPKIDWIDLFNTNYSNDKTKKEQTITTTTTTTKTFKQMPLYPLGACYVPSQSNHTLINTHPRNIKMALDLQKGFYEEYFCVSLCASDTNRVAKVGTMMKVQCLDIQNNPNANIDDIEKDVKNIRRIVVTCSPVQRVEIQSIQSPDNPQQDYYMAYVCPLSDDNNESHNNDNDTDTDTEPTPNEKEQQLIEQIFKDYAMVRYTYKSQDKIAVGTLPPFAVKSMQEIPPITKESLQTTTSTTSSSSSLSSSSTSFWNSVETWQTLCYTLREAKVVSIQSDINEILIQAKIKENEISGNGGPLNLPIRKSDVNVKTQLDIEQMEQSTLQEFLDAGMDPCLDVQFLLSTHSKLERLVLFSYMISRERKRLEAKQTLRSSFLLDLDDLDSSFPSSFQ